MNLLGREVNTKLLFWTILLVVVAGILIAVRAILPPFFLALALAYVLNPLVTWLEKRRVPRLQGIVVVYLTAIFLVVLLFFWGVPIILGELQEFGNKIPVYASQLSAIVDNFNKNYQQIRFPEGIRAVIDESIDRLEMNVLAIVRRLAQGAFSFLSQLLGLLLAPVLAFYMLKDSDELVAGIKVNVPFFGRRDVLDLWSQIDQVLTRFVRGHLTVAMLVGLMTGVGLALLGMEFSLLLGIVVGLSDLIPYFGPFIGAVPVLAMAALKSPYMVLYAALLMLAVQQLESNLIAPKILSDSIGLHPLMIVFSLLAGGHLFGLVGMLVAVPVAAVLKILVSYAWQKVVVVDK